MFTGIITEVGRVISATNSGGGLKLAIEAPRSAAELAVGDSVSLNGACQTVVERTPSQFTVEAVEETLSKTTLGEFKAGSAVNLELPLRLSDRLGGHMVLGHVDGVGRIVGIDVKESSRLVHVQCPSSFMRYVIPVGSIAIDGISLTVADVRDNTLTVSIIPHTLERTSLSTARVGTKVNLEFDVLGKYVEKLLAGKSEPEQRSKVTRDKLASWGYDV
jgi:riboflavin synthase